MTVIAITAWFALALQLYLMLNRAPSIGLSTTNAVINFFSYFTILSNLLVAKSLTSSLLLPSSLLGNFFSKVSVQSSIAVYIFIVGLVYNLVLRSLWNPEGWQLLADNLLHVAVPLLYVLFWLIFTPKKVLRWKNIFPWLIFPAVYLVYSLLRGAATGWYPYPFINADKLGYGKTAVNSLLVLVAIIVVGTGVIAYNRSTKKQSN